MTNQEAIEIIKTAIAEVEWEYPMDYAGAFDMAVEALEKQIPKKLIKNGNDLACLNCGSDEQFIIYKKNIIPEYCPICGQALEVGDN